MLAQQKRNTKGFSLIELLVVVALIGIVAGMGFPKFDTWKKKRHIESQHEKIGTYLTSAVSQVERGSYPYVQIKFSSVNNNYQVVTRALPQNKFSLALNQGKTLSCSADNFSSSNGGIELSNYSLSDKIKIFPSASGKTTFSICFSKGGTYFNKTGTADGVDPIGFDGGKTAIYNYIVICSFETACIPKTKAFDNFTYGIRYSRFGLIEKYKYSLSNASWKSR